MQCGFSSRDHAGTSLFRVVPRWPNLDSLPPVRVLSKHFSVTGQLQHTEPLAVAAFTSALTETHAGCPACRTWAIDIGANLGVYSTLAALLSVPVISVEMQPGCVALARCHLRLNNVSARVSLLNRFVASESITEPVDVPTAPCGMMASPTAVAGDWRAFRASERSHDLWPILRGELRRVCSCFAQGGGYMA